MSENNCNFWNGNLINGGNYWNFNKRGWVKITGGNFWIVCVDRRPSKLKPPGGNPYHFFYNMWFSRYFMQIKVLSKIPVSGKFLVISQAIH